MEQHEYKLQRYGGISTRHTCPACGKKHCFTLYINEEGEPLADTVGRCDHESSCGYHYTPKEYFHDHPDAGHDWRENFMTQPLKIKTPPIPKKPLCTIPNDIVTRSVNPRRKSSFTQFLTTLLGETTVATLTQQYRLGVTKTGEVIYFQIDIRGRCRTGKIMKYDPQTGHRIKDQATAGRIDWVHSKMKRNGTLPQDWQLTQCLFGEHLLPQYPGRSVALVESEKTALICAALMPEHIWLATGGKSQLSEEKMRPLRGRTIIAFPDIDAYDTWRQKLSELKGYDITISEYLEKTATQEQRENHIDIADLLIADCPKTRDTAWDTVPQPTWQHPLDNPEFRRIIHCLSPENYGPVAQLMADLDLIPTTITPPPTVPVPQ